MNNKSRERISLLEQMFCFSDYGQLEGCSQQEWRELLLMSPHLQKN